MHPNEGSWLVIQAVNPTTVCNDSALLVNGLRTLGVALHPGMPFRIEHEEIGGKPQTKWTWLVADKAADGVKTGDIIAKWNDQTWLAQNPTHEIAIVRATMANLAILAEEARTAIPRIVIRRGDRFAHIPTNASPARRAHLLGQLEGTIPLNKRFVEPAEAVTG